ncbi:hypothetical protein [Streptomyces sp. NPDC049555]|uniref:hypothetical protein n=1 Tax=unclassified Streptomyces TaxID=2593676 RepID=UPI0034370677
MPLSNLAAAESAAQEARPSAPEDLYEDRRRWRRPYQPGPLRVGGAALLLLPAAGLMLATLITALAGALIVAAVCLVLATVLVMLAVRLVRAGIWVGAEGLRQQRLLSGTTLPWAEVGDIRVVPQPVRRLGVLGTVEGQALVVHRAQGEPLPVLVADQGTDFLGRPQAFTTAVAATRAWVTELRG